MGNRFCKGVPRGFLVTGWSITANYSVFATEASRNDKPREILRASFKRVNLETVFLKEFLVVFLWLHSSTISRNAVFARENVFFADIPAIAKNAVFRQGKCFFAHVSRNETAREFLRRSFETVIWKQSF